MKVRRLFRMDDGSRRQFWPIRFYWASRKCALHFFDWHGWQTGTEEVPLGQESSRCMPGYRDVFGWTLHIGRFQVLFGKDLPRQTREEWCEAAWLRYRDFVAAGYEHLRGPMENFFDGAHDWDSLTEEEVGEVLADLIAAGSREAADRIWDRVVRRRIRRMPVSAPGGLA